MQMDDGQAAFFWVGDLGIRRALPGRTGGLEAIGQNRLHRMFDLLGVPGTGSHRYWRPRGSTRRLDELATEAWVPQDALAHLRSHYTHKLEALSETIDGEGDERFDGHEPGEPQLRREVLAAERAAVISLRDRGRIDDETLRLVERELDLEEQRLH